MKDTTTADAVNPSDTARQELEVAMSYEGSAEERQAKKEIVREKEKMDNELSPRQVKLLEIVNLVIGLTQQGTRFSCRRKRQGPSGQRSARESSCG